MTHIAAGKNAPIFALKSLDGKDFSLGKMLERGPAVVAFFKVSCPVCQFTFPFIERLHQRYGGDVATIVGISQDDARATKDFAKQYGATFPMLMDEKGKGYAVSNAYGLTMVPTVFLINTDGSVKVSCMGFGKAELEAIAAELSERQKIKPIALFRADESVPANRPG